MEAVAEEKALRRIEAKELAIGIQISAAVGPNRSVTMTSGVPMDTTPIQLNEYVDKMFYVLDRQQWKGELEMLRKTLEAAEKDLQTSVLQLADFRKRAENDWERSNRRGEFRMTDSQEKQQQNFLTNQRHLREERIPLLRKQLGELEAKIEGN